LVRSASLALLATGPGCQRDAPPGSRGAPPDCELQDVSERASPATLDDLQDPIAQLVLRQGCPVDFAAVQTKLAQVDASACDAGMFAADRTTLISEIASVRGVADGDVEGCTPRPAAFYRGVVQRTCAGRQPWELMLSVAPFATSIDDLPKDLEAMGWDRVHEEFNYYTLEDGTWRFHGGSRDMLRGMGDEGQRRCAACHVGGGLVMKELDSPWPYWEGRLTTAGIDAVLQAHPELGSRTEGKVIDFRPAGKELEDAVTAGNVAWSKSRVAYVRAHGTLRQLLRPLLCTDTINLAAATDTASPPSQTAAAGGALQLASSLLVDPRVGAGVDVRLRLPLADYHARLAQTGQRVESGCGAKLVDGEGRPLIDAPFDLVWPVRSREDRQFVDASIEAGVLDEGLARALLAVDFTQPAFSADRCGLLDVVPDVPLQGLAAADLRRMVAAAVAEVDTEPAAQLRRNLGDGASIEPRVRRFLTSCAARPADALTSDIVTWVSELRRRAGALSIMEFSETLPVDDLPPQPGLRLSPGTCELRGRDTP
jgi:hypothetical protein